MARTEFGAIITGMRGSIGGVTFSASGGLTVAKRKPRPALPTTSGQVASQNVMRQWAPAWKNETPGQRNLWRLYALTVPLVNSLGQTYYLRSLMMYLRYAQFLNTRGMTGTPAVPGLTGLPVVPTATWSVAAGVLTLDALAPAAIGGEVIAGSVLPCTTRTINNPKQVVHSTFTTDGQTLPYTVASDLDVGWTAGTDLKAWVEWRWMDVNGRLSNLVRESVNFTV
jgi:hypothetical protein